MNAFIDNLLIFVLKVVDFVFNLLFGWLNLPDFPTSLKTTVNTYLNYIFDNLDILSFFVRVSTLQTIFKLFIIVYISKYTFKLIMFIASTLPKGIGNWLGFNTIKNI